jgi:hypothetical protein
MSTEIKTLATVRAHTLAKLEELSQTGNPSSDREERRAFQEALAKAQEAYRGAEERFQRATATYSDEELKAILGPSWGGKYPSNGKRAA